MSILKLEDLVGLSDCEQTHPVKGLQCACVKFAICVLQKLSDCTFAKHACKICLQNVPTTYAVRLLTITFKNVHSMILPAMLQL